MCERANVNVYQVSCVRKAFGL